MKEKMKKKDGCNGPRWMVVGGMGHGVSVSVVAERRDPAVYRLDLHRRLPSFNTQRPSRRAELPHSYVFRLSDVDAASCIHCTTIRRLSLFLFRTSSSFMSEVPLPLLHRARLQRPDSSVLTKRPNAICPSTPLQTLYCQTFFSMK